MEKLVLVHLSDIHFAGSSGTSVHDLDADVRNELLRDAAKLMKDLGSATGVLVTGDIAFSGKREQYERAATWLVDLCEVIGCREESVWVVPGNHDVDRDRTKSKVTKTLHESIRRKDEASIDAELREIFSDPQSANALLDPLTEYNTFAARFECTVTPTTPFWERDLTLSCGTIIRLRGLCSALVCNASDAKGNIVLGTAQASVPRIDGVAVPDALPPPARLASRPGRGRYPARVQGSNPALRPQARAASAGDQQDAPSDRRGDASRAQRSGLGAHVQRH